MNNFIIPDWDLLRYMGMSNANAVNQTIQQQQLAALGQYSTTAQTKVYFNDMPNHGPVKTRCSYCRTLGTEDKCVNCGAPR